MSPRPSVCLCVSVCVSVRKVYCGKTAERIRIPFAVVSGGGRGMGALDGVVIVEGKGSFGVNLGRPVVTMGPLRRSLLKLL